MNIDVCGRKPREKVELQQGQASPSGPFEQRRRPCCVLPAPWRSHDGWMFCRTIRPKRTWAVCVGGYSSRRRSGHVSSLVHRQSIYWRAACVSIYYTTIRTVRDLSRSNLSLAIGTPEKIVVVSSLTLRTLEMNVCERLFKKKKKNT